VLVTNQRSVAEILSTMRMVAGLVGAQVRAEAWISACLARHAESPMPAERGRSGRACISRSGTSR
jgi:hypothetical protein